MKRIFVFLLICSINLVYGQETDLFIPQNFARTFAKNTRSPEGRPGENYWQNRADYDIQVGLNPETGLITGSEQITYFNNSPDTLDYLIIHLFPNLYKKGHAREFDVQPADESEGVILKNISVNGIDIDDTERTQWIEYIHSDLRLYLDPPLPPQSKCNITLDWEYKINRHSHNRTGAVDTSTFFVAYFFPRIGVYDDIDGWNELRYSGIAEFYNDFGNFKVEIAVPRHFIVWATGTLTNVADVLTKKYRERFLKASVSDEIFHIIDSTENNRKDITAANDINLWKFQADNITDFAFAISNHYLWDATSLVVDKSTGRRVVIDAAYNKRSDDFYHVISIARKAIEYMSFRLPGVPFPFPKETVFNGLDEMEYPMMVNDMSFDDLDYVFKLTSHEISHSYFPFLTGINETKYAWMDEGWASFFDYYICYDLLGAEKASVYYLDKYKSDAALDLNLPLMAVSAYLKRPVYHYNSYAKPAVFLFIVKDLLGDAVFKTFLHEFVKRWKGKHPMPYDFFYTLNQSTGSNLNWLIQPWFFEFGYTDLAITDVKHGNNGVQILIRKKGHYPVPLFLQITYTDGTITELHKNVSVWKNGADTYTFTLSGDKPIRRLRLDHDLIPDANPEDNVWSTEKSE